MLKRNASNQVTFFLEIFLTYSDYPVSRLRRGTFYGGVAPFVNLSIRRTIPLLLQLILLQLLITRRAGQSNVW